MPRKKNKENEGLPSRWRKTHGAYYYQVPIGFEHLWDGKKTFRLGRTLPEAYKAWGDRQIEIDEAKTIGDLLDRYALEIIPTKSLPSQNRDKQSLKILRSTFGKMPIGAIKPQHVFMYVDKRSKKETIADGSVRGGLATARREVALLSHVYTMAIKWGCVERHPFKGQLALETTKPRTRYVENWEISECMSLPSLQKKGSVKAIQAYIRLKLLTGLRTRDMLQITESDIREDGIHVHTSKTGKYIIVEWDDEGQLRAAVQAAKDARPIAFSPFLFCTKRGKGYVNPETGRAEGWTSMWQRFMDRVLKETRVTERFTEHDLRAKSGSDAGSLEHARSLLAHTDFRTTQKHYRRAAERVQPSKTAFE